MLTYSDHTTFQFQMVVNEGILILLPQPCFYFWQSSKYLTEKIENEFKKYEKIPFYERKATIFDFITNKITDKNADIVYEQFWKVTNFEKNDSKTIMMPLEVILPRNITLKDVIF